MSSCEACRIFVRQIEQADALLRLLPREAYLHSMTSRCEPSEDGDGAMASDSPAPNLGSEQQPYRNLQ